VKIDTFHDESKLDQRGLWGPIFVLDPFGGTKPRLAGREKKPCSGSTLSLWPDPRPESRRVDFAYISRKFPSDPRLFP